MTKGSVRNPHRWKNPPEVPSDDFDDSFPLVEAVKLDVETQVWCGTGGAKSKFKHHWAAMMFFHPFRKISSLHFKDGHIGPNSNLIATTFKISLRRWASATKAKCDSKWDCHWVLPSTFKNYRKVPHQFQEIFPSKPTSHNLAFFLVPRDHPGSPGPQPTDFPWTSLSGSPRKVLQL